MINQPNIWGLFINMVILGMVYYWLYHLTYIYIYTIIHSIYSNTSKNLSNLLTLSDLDIHCSSIAIYLDPPPLGY